MLLLAHGNMLSHLTPESGLSDAILTLPHFEYCPSRVLLAVCGIQLCHITYASGESRDVMKTPKSSAAKTSLPGQLFVGRSGPGAPPMVFPKGDPSCKGMEPVMQIVYNKRPVPGVFEDFSAVRARVNREWQAVVCFALPPPHVSCSL